MPEPVICLSCGLPVLDRASDVASDSPVCHCASSDEAGSVRCPDCGAALKIGARACGHCGSTVATVRCSACLTWNLADAVHCQQCGRRLEDGVLSNVGTTAPSCPRCANALGTRRYAELPVDECDRCGGMFLSPESMNRIVAEHDLPTGLTLDLPQRRAVRETEVHYIHCPVCAGLMNRQAFGRISGVVVDVCRKHGVWFDAGELFEVVRFIESGGLARARERELADVMEQERRQRMDLPQAEEVGDLGTGVRPIHMGFGHTALADLADEIVEFVAQMWR
ncbi:MAG: zf-TFIIB domain-containing protein [Polyangiaceae bacterium]